MSALSGLQGADYPLYVVNVGLSTGQAFSYTMIFQSGLPTGIDDGALIASAQAIRAYLNGPAAAALLPAGAQVSSLTVARYNEVTQQRTIV